MPTANGSQPQYTSISDSNPLLISKVFPYFSMKSNILLSF